MNTWETRLSDDAILDERAAKYAAGAQTTVEKRVIDTVAILGVGRQRFGISSPKLEVIEKTPPIAHIPEPPPMVRGVVQIRGELIAAVDLAAWFRIDGSTGSHIAVMTVGKGIKLGGLVDSVLGFRDIEEGEMVKTFFDSGDKGGRPVLGATRDLVTLLDVDKLFKSSKIRRDIKSDKRRGRGQ